MANLSKLKRDQMIAFLEKLKEAHSDDTSIQAFNEIENHIRDKKYGLVWEEHSEQVDELLKENIPILTADPERRLCKDASLPWNFIIEGDNLQALYLLQKTHKGKVDCIYIDPPYNTGARDWKYNNDYVDGTDVYRHSKWLSMMKNRLMLAKELLKPTDSVLICTIDEKEYLRLGCLLEELFPEARIQMISTMINPANVARVGGFGRSGEYIYFVMNGTAAPHPLELDRDWVSSKGRTHTGNVRWDLLKRSGTSAARSDSPGGFYPIYIDIQTNEIKFVGEPLPEGVSEAEEHPGLYPLLPIRKDGSEGRWQWTPETFRERQEQGRVKIGGNYLKGYTVYILKDGEYSKIQSGAFQEIGRGLNNEIITEESESDTVMAIPGDIWKIPSHDATQYGSRLLGNILGEKRFTFPKSLYATHDALRFFMDKRPNGVVVDFFAGSGTTLHAVNLLNAEDGGQRRCIIVTNNEVSADEAKKLAGEGYKPGDDEWEKYGIAKYVTWPRTKCCIEGQDLKGTALRGDYISIGEKDIHLADGFNSNVKFFKCSWTPRKPEDYLLSNALCLHIKEMIELQNAIEVDNVKNVLILNKDDIKKTVFNPDVRPKIENLWVNQNIIFSTDELKALKEIGYKYIPREFFGQELREAAE